MKKSLNWPILISISIPLILIFILLFFGESGFNANDSFVLWELRLPKIIVAFFAGGLMAVCGYLLQVYFQNPLAGPDLLGINSGASLGIALSIMGFSSSSGIFVIAQPMMALAGAVLVMLLLGIFIRKNLSRITILILGLLIASFTSSLISILVNISPGLEVKNYFVWAMGTFQGVPLSSLLSFTVLSLIALFTLIKIPFKLNLLALGDDYAKSMGLAVKKFKLQLLIITSFIVAIVTIFCGPIGFIGVIAPHLSRWLIRRSDARLILPVSFLMGSSIALLTEVILFISHEYSLATNSILGLIGAPVIALYLFKARRIA